MARGKKNQADTNEKVFTQATLVGSRVYAPGDPIPVKQEKVSEPEIVKVEPESE